MQEGNHVESKTTFVEIKQLLKQMTSLHHGLTRTINLNCHL